MMDSLYKEFDKVPMYLYLESQNELNSIDTEDTEEIKSSQINDLDENEIDSNLPKEDTIKTIDDGVNTLFGVLTKQECTQNDDQKVDCYILKLSAPINLVPSRDVLEELVFDRKYLNNITEVELSEDNRLQNYIDKQVTVKGQIIVAQTGGWHRYVGLSVIDIINKQ